MTQDEIDEIRQYLVSRRDELTRTLDGDLNSLKNFRVKTFGDMADVALDSAHGEINSQIAEVESKELTKIEHALQRIEDGEYGICEECKEEIPSVRLIALPYAICCVICQRKREHSFSVIG